MVVPVLRKQKRQALKSCQRKSVSTTEGAQGSDITSPSHELLTVLVTRRLGQSCAGLRRAAPWEACAPLREGAWAWLLLSVTATSLGHSPLDAVLHEGL